MNLAVAEPNATKKPTVKISASTHNAALEAMNKFEGPAKGMRFKANENARIPSSSNKPANSAAPTSNFFFGWNKLENMA
jgi:hypothetical protein